MPTGAAPETPTGCYGTDSILQLSVPEIRFAENRLRVMPVPAVMQQPYRPLPSSRTWNRSPPGTSHDPPGPNSMPTSHVPAWLVIGPAGRSTVTENDSIANRPAGSCPSTRTFATPKFCAVISSMVPDSATGATCVLLEVAV